ncbi:hypothetical protein Esti_003136 [Eimeria stiedai]
MRSVHSSRSSSSSTLSLGLLLFVAAGRLSPGRSGVHTAAAAAPAAAAPAAAAPTAGEFYPEYCLKEWTVEERRVVPPLSAQAKGLHLQLQQVHALVRHGARAPYDKNCWQWAAAAAGSAAAAADLLATDSSRSSISKGRKHGALAADQDALRSDAERCPPVGHQRTTDCAAAAAAASEEVDASSLGASLLTSSEVRTAAAESDELLLGAHTEAAAAAAAAAHEAASGEGSSGAAEAAGQHQAAAAAAAAELGPPWECAIREELGMTASPSGDLSTPLLVKEYAAAEGETGLFRGSCLPSSLLDEGQTQLRLIGAILSKAYVRPEPSHGHLQHQQEQVQEQQVQQQQLVAPLFTAEELKLNVKQRLLVRSTDIPRTLASGAFLLESFLGSCGLVSQRISVVTYELSADPLLAGYNAPLVERLRQQAEASPEFRALVAQQEALREELRWELRLSIPEFEALWPEVIVDCALTYVCSGRRHLLPVALQQQQGLMLQQLLQFNDQISSFWLSWRDAAAAYAAAQPLFHELLRRILGPINLKQQHAAAAAAAGGDAPLLPAFSLYMTHDVTLISVLAALRVHGGLWPPYASMAVFEVYQHLKEHPNSSSSSSNKDTGGSYLFRLVYNGEVLTAKMPGCVGEALAAPDLCSLDVLLSRMQNPPAIPPPQQQEEQKQEQQQQERQEEM